MIAELEMPLQIAQDKRSRREIAPAYRQIHIDLHGDAIARAIHLLDIVAAELHTGDVWAQRAGADYGYRFAQRASRASIFGQMSACLAARARISIAIEGPHDATLVSLLQQIRRARQDILRGESKGHQSVDGYGYRYQVAPAGSYCFEADAGIALDTIAKSPYHAALPLKLAD